MDTREQILKAAWDLFAEKGFEAVSVRDVTNAAGVNLASVSYHFGGKEGLIQETVKLCMNPINQYRLKLLAAAVEKHGSIDKIPVRDLMNALLRPAVLPEECGVASGLMLRLVARYFIESDYAIPTVSRNLYTEVFQSFAMAFTHHYPHLTPQMIVKRIVYVSGSVIYFLGLGRLASQLSSGSQNQPDEIDREAMLEEVIDFAMHGFTGEDGASK